MALALNILQWLICHFTKKPNQNITWTLFIQILIYLYNPTQWHSRAVSHKLHSYSKDGKLISVVWPLVLLMVLDASFLITQHYQVGIKGKVDQTKERSSAIPYTLVLKLLKREPLGHPRLQSPTLLTYYLNIHLLIVQWNIKINVDDLYEER